MALKITVPIGTDQGITSEAYVRISDYQISKLGNAVFKIQVFQSAADAQQLAGGIPANTNSARNQQIGESLHVSLTKSQEVETVVKRMVPVEVEVEGTFPGNRLQDGPEATITKMVTEIQMVEQDVIETTTIQVPDLSAAEAVNIFDFGYSQLKTKLVDMFGSDNIIDC